MPRKPKYKFPEHKFPFHTGQIDNFKIKGLVMPVEWANGEFVLSKAYAIQGKITLFFWQEEPLNAIVDHDFVMYIAPVQTGKSFLAEIIVGWVIDVRTGNILCIYAKNKTVKEVFEERLGPMVREVPAIRKYWDGKPNSLTQEKITLMNCLVRVGSAGVKTDIATHNSSFIYGSELAKWPAKDFSQTKAIQGRGEGSRMMGKATKVLFETSPDNDKDPSYVEAHKPGTQIRYPFYPCPLCGVYQQLTDHQIKELPNKKGIYDHSPQRIRETRAVWYECSSCHKEITEHARIDMSKRIRYATETETIDNQGVIRGRTPTRRLVFNWNRFVDITFTFSECLARYFEALASPDPNELKTYQNEDMARWVKMKADRMQDAFIESKKEKYYQAGSNAYIPDAVRILLIGIDTMDNGFRWVIRGYGEGMESWLVREDFCFCDMKDDQYKNPVNVLKCLNDHIYEYPYQKQSGALMDITFGFIDRGGHRSKDVDYIASHSHNIGIYIGSTNKKAALIERSKTANHFMGQTEMLSRIVQSDMEGDLWHLPWDIKSGYRKEIRNQFDQSWVDTRGNKKTKWVSEDPDHSRDAENYLTAARILLKLDEEMFDEAKAARIEKMATKDEARTVEQKIEHQDNAIGAYRDELNSQGW